MCKGRSFSCKFLTFSKPSVPAATKDISRRFLETIDNSLRQNIAMKFFFKRKKKFEGEPDYQIHMMNWGSVAVKNYKVEI